MSRPDVAIVAPYPGAGQRHGGFSGVASYTANLANALADQGAEVTVVATLEEGEPPVSLDGRVRVERCFRRGVAALPVAARAAVATGAPVVHFQHETFLWGGPAALPGIVPALVRGKHRNVVTMHQVVDPADVDRSYTQLHRVTAPALVARQAVRSLQAAIRRLADATIVHEPSFRRFVPGAVVIPHGVERRVTPPQDEARARLGVRGDGLVVLCFGFLAPYKGLEAVLRAAELAGPAVELVVAGGAHPRLGGRDVYGERLRARWSDVARFTGWVPEEDVSPWFAAADVVVFPYPQPFASSGALALAMAHATPALVSKQLARSAELPDVLAVAPEPLPLAARLLALERQRAGLRPLADAVSGLAEDHAWPVVARRHLALYEEVTDADVAARRCVRAGQPG